MAQTVCIVLRAADRERLAAIVSDRNRQHKHIERARVVLASAEPARPVQQVAEAVGVSRPMVWRWQQRFAEEGPDGLLRDKTRKPGKAPIPAKTVERVVALTCGKPPGETTHWTGRAMAKAVGISLRSVQRIWEAHRLQPHRVRSFKRSRDPQFTDKLVDVVGLYLDPPEHAVVLSIDEKRFYAGGRRPEVGKLGCCHFSLRRYPMQRTVPLCYPRSAARRHDTSLFVALEFSKSIWLLAVSAPGRDRISKYRVPSGDIAALLSLLTRLRTEAERRCSEVVKIISIYEAGLDGFWPHRALEAADVESHVVDAASIAVNRRSRRAKTDRIDVETLLRTLMGWARGELRICSMVRPPSPEEEDARRLTREREALVTERVRHVNRIKGLLSTQGVVGFEPIRKDRRKRLEELCRWDGQPLPARLKKELLRELDRLELVMSQLAALETERDRILQASQTACQVVTQRPTAQPASTVAGTHLLRLRGIGPEIASVLSLEAFYRSFANRREVAAYSGLAPSPWKSGGIDIEQGISKAGNARLRRTTIQLAWLWLRHQPGSSLSRWFHQRVGDQRGKIRRIAIVAVARKLLVALWHYVTQGLVPAGAELKA